jgi:hypothetical protein
LIAVSELDSTELLQVAGPLLHQMQASASSCQAFSESNHVLSLSLQADTAAESRFLTAVKDRSNIGVRWVHRAPIEQMNSTILMEEAHKAALLRFMQDLPVSVHEHSNNYFKVANMDRGSH